MSVGVCLCHLSANALTILNITDTIGENDVICVIQIAVKVFRNYEVRDKEPLIVSNRNSNAVLTNKRLHPF